MTRNDRDHAYDLGQAVELLMSHADWRAMHAVEEVFVTLAKAFHGDERTQLTQAYSDGRHAARQKAGLP